MAQTSQAEVQRLVDRALKLGDAELAADIRAFAKQREFGLVFEHNRPERMRLYGKLVSVGDTVQVMAPRGEKETDKNRVCWKVESMSDDVAKLASIDAPGETFEAALEDLVTIAEYDEPIYAGLRETGRVERGGDKPYQVVINGENYHALESLLFCYTGKVDCIYIDPPYNTGARDWKYNNDYVDGSDEYRHSKWLAMMERRLKLAKQLLNPTKSVLICTIDEKEYLRLGMLLEDVFSSARIQMVSININPAAVARANEFGRVDEYAFFVMQGIGPERLKLSPEWITAKGRTHTGHIRWDLLKRSGTRTQRKDSPGCFYPIYAKDGVIQSIGEAIPLEMNREDLPVPDGLDAIWPIRQNGTEGNWQLQPKNLRVLWKQGFVKLGKAKGSAATVYYLKPGERQKIEKGIYTIVGRNSDGSVITSDAEDTEFASVPGTQWHIAAHDSTQYGSRLLQKILGDKRFTFPKSLYAVEDTIRFFVANNPSALIVDFFSGSGTTAHAIMRLNHQDGGQRRCICVTNNEVSDDESKVLRNRGCRRGDPEWEHLGICEYVTKPRIKSAITGLTPNGEPIKGDYKFVDEFPMADGFEENAVFYDLTYEDPRMVEFGESFDAVAPLLWLRAGARGSVIEREQKGFAVADTYAVLFTYAYANEFVEAVSLNPGIRYAFVVTDDEGRFASIAARLPGRDVVRLYESYLQSFKIAAEGAVN